MSSKPGLREQQRERTRQAILDRGRRIFAERGYDKTNVSEIARSVGVAHGTIYYHFPDKKALLLAVLGEFFDQARTLAEQWAEVTDTGPETASRFMRSVANLLHEHQDVARILRNESYNPDPAIQGLIQSTFHFLVDQTARALESGIALGSVRPLDTRIAALAQIGILKEVVFGLLEDNQPIDLDYVVQQIADLQNYGIRPRGPAARGKDAREGSGENVP